MTENESRSLSAARAIAIVLVVIGHSMTAEIRGIDPRIDFMWSIIYSFHMFFFFFISGMLFEKNIRKYREDKSNFLTGKFKLLMIPYITITIIEYFVLFVINNLLILLGRGEMINGVSIKGFFNAIIFNESHYDTHLWYIYLLFFIFAINILVRKREILSIITLGCIVLVLGYPFLSYIPWKFQSLVYYIVPFVLGRLFHNRHFLKLCIGQNGIRICIYGISMILLNGLIYYLEKIYIGNLFGIPGLRIGIVQEIKFITGLMGCILLVHFGNKLSQISAVKEIVKILDRCSYEIYLYHQPFITVGCATVLLKLKFPVLINLVFSTCVGIIIPVLISKILLRKNPLLRKLFLGGH